MNKCVGFIEKLCLSAAILSTCYAVQAQSYAAPRVFRNATTYDLSLHPYALLVITTSPAQPNQPIYGWRNQSNFYNPGVPGALAYNGNLIGYTDNNGSYVNGLTVPDLDYICGKYSQETYTVGSLNGLKSTPLAFRVYRTVDTGPINGNCSPY